MEKKYSKDRKADICDEFVHMSDVRNPCLNSC